MNCVQLRLRDKIIPPFLFLCLLYVYLIVVIYLFIDPNTQKGTTLFVLCEQELAAFDLEAPKLVLADKYD